MKQIKVLRGPICPQCKCPMEYIKGEGHFQCRVHRHKADPEIVTVIPTGVREYTKIGSTGLHTHCMDFVAKRFLKDNS